MEDKEVLTLPMPQFKAAVVQLILSRETERAVDIVSKKYGTRTPNLGIGATKGRKVALAVYSVSANSILFSDQNHFFDPFVVLHEMYHCIRSKSGSHRGTEKNADRFALDFIMEYQRHVTSVFNFQISKVD
ncbi:MAG: hypothetical protein JRN20_10390 [Nitrososphaerota archaeon]|nr:hypothetical protein [Nitrososphaerota archaeon]MDG6924115.1 hypothetical protein [Nitrososphaerota archaeon]